MRDAGLQSLMNEPGLFRCNDALADVIGGNQHFDRGHASGPIGAAHEALGDDGLEHSRHLQADLLLLRWRKDRDDAVNGLGCIQGVQR